MIYKEILEKIQEMMQGAELDTVVLGNLQNIQYATGVRIDCASAQPDLVILGFLARGKKAVVIVPEIWAAAAAQHAHDADIIGYGLNDCSIQAAVNVLTGLYGEFEKSGIDSGAMAARLAESIEARLSGLTTLVRCDADFQALRARKTPAEIEKLKAIALKADHIINGSLHHLIADRKKTAMSLAESLRVHSLERDIPLQGYNASCRAIVGDDMADFWAYAPHFGFAGTQSSNVGDAMITEVVASRDGYWSNGARVAINSNAMNQGQAKTYDDLVRLRKLLCAALRPGKTAGEVYAEVKFAADKEGIAFVENLPLGFSIGVSAYEAPFLAPGDQTPLTEGMVFVLDPVVVHNGQNYRSRDTVVVGDSKVEIINWYKDWREPYFAIPTI